MSAVALHTHRHAPGTLMERQGKGMDLFHSGMSIVMTDVEGSTSLWEWNSRIMNSALALHDHTLRSLLPKYFGYEVSLPAHLLRLCLSCLLQA